MRLDEVLLKKEELPIYVGSDLQCPVFQAPIHPRLLEPSVSLNPQLAVEVFPDVAKEWHEDLRVFYERMEEGSTRDWVRAFLDVGSDDWGGFIELSVYGHHNIDHYPGALFLRNWAIKYLNEALRSLGD